MSEPPNPPWQAESEALQTLAALLEVIGCLDRHVGLGWSLLWSVAMAR
jgi:hypothetical protein